MVFIEPSYGDLSIPNPSYTSLGLKPLSSFLEIAKTNIPFITVKAFPF